MSRITVQPRGGKIYVEDDRIIVTPETSSAVVAADHFNGMLPRAAQQREERIIVENDRIIVTPRVPSVPLIDYDERHMPVYRSTELSTIVPQPLLVPVQPPVETLGNQIYPMELCSNNKIVGSLALAKHLGWHDRDEGVCAHSCVPHN